MSFHDHDPDRIMSLAEGRFSGDEGELRRELQECPECAADLAAHEMALAALGELRGRPDVELTELEAARLRRHLEEELGHRRTPQPVAVQRAERRFNWAPVFSVAAVLLALLLVAPALNLLGGSDDSGDSASLDVAFDEFDAGADDRASLQRAPTAALESTEPGVAAEDAAETGGTDALQLQLLAILAAFENADGDAAALGTAIAPTYAYAPAAPPDACIDEGRITAGNPLSSETVGDVLLVPGEPPLTITVHRLAAGDYVVVAHVPVTCVPVAQVP